MATDNNTIEIKKSTGITVSLAILTALVVGGFTIGSWVSGVNAQVGRNTEDIRGLGPKIEKLNDNLQTTNNNVVQLQTLLQSVQDELRR